MGVILFICLPSGVGCADPVEPDFLADPEVLDAPAADPGLFDFLMRLLEGLEKVCLSLPKAWPHFADLFRGVCLERGS